jgi:hypothetical protein
MKALTALRRFILVNSNTETQHEIRLYVQENLFDLARDFCVSTDSLTEALEKVPDDAALAVRLLETVRHSEAKQRDIKRVGRATAAQASADALASMATWDGDRIQVDLLSLLSSVLTKRQDLLIFTTDEFTVAIYQAPLCDLAKLKRRDLTAFVDANGVHIRWKTGGLNLRSQVDHRDADRIVMSVARNQAAVAA